MLYKMHEINTLIKKHQKEGGGSLVLPLADVLNPLHCKTIVIGVLGDNDTIADAIEVVVRQNPNIVKVDKFKADRFEDQHVFGKSTLKCNLEAAGLDKDVIFRAHLALLVNEDGVISTIRHSGLPLETQFSI